jgi:hypothetical protein
MKPLITLFCLLVAAKASAQKPPTAPIVAKALVARRDSTTESDTSKENKEPRYYYFSVNTNVFVNTKGGDAKRFSPAIEFGRTYGIFDIGLATGYVNTRSNDTTHYLEFRRSINVFSKGRFAEGLCLGGGYVFSAKQGLVTEICNSIHFNNSANVAVAVTQGYVFFMAPMITEHPIYGTCFYL